MRSLIYRKTKFKTIVACIQFPKDYPQKPLLIELKSKTLSTKLLDGLTEVCEKECKKQLGKAQVTLIPFFWLGNIFIPWYVRKKYFVFLTNLFWQVLPTLKLVRNFIDENPLICCYDEISTLKNILENDDELKLRQKHSCICLKVQQGLYYFKAKIEIPDNYPIACVKYVQKRTVFTHFHAYA